MEVLNEVLVPLFTVDVEVEKEPRDYQVYMSLGKENNVLLRYFELGESISEKNNGIPLRFNLSTKNLSATNTKCDLQKSLVSKYREAGEDLREAFYDLITTEKASLEKAHTYIIPSHCSKDSQKWLPFNDILSTNGSIAGSGSDCTFQLELNDQKYFIEDCYRPFIDKQEILLKGYISQNTKPLKIAFNLIIDLDGNIVSILPQGELSTEDVTNIYSNIRKIYLCHKIFFRPRYEVMQKLGQRHESIKEWQNKSNKTGRNDPCPCGSSKKYKKCCLNRPLIERPKLLLKQSFTLIELLIVLIIIGLLAAIVAPNMIGKVATSKVQTAKVQMELLSTGLDTFRLDTGSYPDTLEELRNSTKKNWQGPYLSKKLPLDPWGNPYVYRNEKPYVLLSYGKDGAPGGEELDADIIYDNE